MVEDYRSLIRIGEEQLGMFMQGDYVRDYVFPILVVDKSSHDWVLKSFLGTGFFIGSAGFGLTAAHVVKGGGDLAAIFADASGEWTAFDLTVIEVSDDDDVALVKVKGNHWKKSIFVLDESPVHSSFRYRMFGYPEDILYEGSGHFSGRVFARPDLVYSEGYVRRRVSYEIGVPGVKGRSFLELSEIAGRGCSGAPIFTARDWRVVGLYAAERIVEGLLGVSFGVRAEGFGKWTPKALGQSVTSHSNS